VFTGF